MISDSDAYAAIVLASLPAMTPRRLRSLLHERHPNDVLVTLDSWRPKARAHSNPLDALFASPSSRTDTRNLASVWQHALDDVRTKVAASAAAGNVADMDVNVLGDPGYPKALAQDPQAPAVLFSHGNLSALDQPSVAIIGTRHATAHGRSVARYFGEVLCEHGVAVVSGLARGIDVSAHRGVLHRMAEHRDAVTPSADGLGVPIGVVASGLDVVYPPEHGDVWNDVARTGVLISESPPGTEPHAYRFPQRNRIIAALCDVLVVVESRATGGSMITVRCALERQVTVMAVPGSTATRAAEGTNLLIRDGASIAVEPDDVLAVLGIEARRRVATFDPRARPMAGDAEILEIVGDQPMTLDHIVHTTKRDLGDVALALGRLEAQGWLMCTAGWFERLARPGV